MAVIYADQLLDRAKTGDTLTTEERRHVVAYLLERPVAENETTPSISEMAKLFNVSERTISNDRKAIKEAVAEELKDIDIGLIIADLTMYHKKIVGNIEKSASKAKLGTTTYLQHQESLWKLQKDYVAGLQDLGILPKELGTMHVDKFEFKASVGLEGAGRPLNAVTDKPLPVVSAEIVSTNKALTDGTNSSPETNPSQEDIQSTRAREIEACLADVASGS